MKAEDFRTTMRSGRKIVGDNMVIYLKTDSNSNSVVRALPSIKTLSWQDLETELGQCTAQASKQTNKQDSLIR
ncbi:MAG: hypothetical protein RL146_269 [Actinomycetota bacterium]